MEHLNVLMSGFLFASAILTIFMSIYSFSTKKTSISVTFSLLCLCFTFYSTGYAMELYHSNLSQMLFWNYIQYIGLPFLPAFWIILAFKYSNNEKYLTPLLKLLIFFIPSVTMILRFTDNYHHLYYANITFFTEGLFPVLAIEKGPWYLVHGIYMSLCIFISGLIYLRGYLRHAGYLRHQCMVMIIASLFPWITFFLNLFNISPGMIDFGPITGTVSCILFLVALFRFQLLDLKPLARDKVFESTNDGIIVLDTKFNIIDFNPRAALIFPVLKSDAFNKSIQTVLSGNERVLAIVMSSSEGQFKLENENEVNHYNIRVSEISLENGILAGLTVTITDVTKYIEALEKLNMVASRDDLTGLNNRRQFFKCSIYELERAKRYKHALSFIIMDLDFFKGINDEYGHQAGDILLKRISQICRQSLRSIDIIGRFGGEEFVILLPETGLGESVEIAERIRKSIESEETIHEGKALKVTASFGVTGLDVITNATIDSFLKNADKALYTAKSEGRNCVRSEIWH